MTVDEFLTQLYRRDIALWADGDKLRYSAPSGTMTPDLRAELAERKPEILAFLRGPNVNQTPAIVPVRRIQDLPLSFAQQRLWFLDQLEPGSTAYNISDAIRLLGALDVTALEQSLTEIVKRHESLRTTFSMIEGEPVQIIAPPLNLSLPLVDLTDSSASEREAKAQHLATEDARRPFDLVRGPLLRVKLLRLGHEDHVLLLALHHIVSDGWSMGLLYRELTLLYKAFTQSQPSPLPDLPIQYADFAVWQREWLQGEVLESQLSYWKTQLKRPPAVLNLPLDRPRPAEQSHRGATQTFMLSEALVESLKALSRNESVTLFMTLLAGFQALLHRYTGQDDIVVGTPIANRNRIEIEGLIGFFINTLALRNDLSANPTFKELLARVRQVALGAYAHQDLPFEKLVEELQPERNLSQSPLFEVMFVLQDASSRDLEFPGMSLSPVKADNSTAKFALTLYLYEEAQGLRGSLEYATDLFNTTTIERMVGHFVILLEGIVANPKQRISELPLFSEAEKHQLLVEWNDTKTDYPNDKCIHELFEAQVEKTPDAIAVVFEDQQLSYRELNNRANQLAHYLQKLGVGPEVLVTVCVERSIEMIVGLLGIFKAGGGYMPLDPSYPQERLRFMLDETHAGIVLTDVGSRNRLPPTSARVICLDRDWEEIVKELQINPQSRSAADDLAYVIYTSGSTGLPKGVVNVHGGLRNRLQWMQDAYRLTAEDRVLQKTPSTFDVSVWEFFWPLISGACLVVARPGGHRDSAYLVELIKSAQITTLHFVPSMLSVFLQEAGVENCTNVRQVFCSGEALSYELQQRFFERMGAALFNLYGPTEASIDVTVWECRSESDRTVVPIGRPIANTQIYILDQQLQPVPIGVTGELLLGGEGLARGYLNRPELTQKKFIANPFSNDPQSRLYKTGDLARYLPDGNIEFLGRLDNQVKIRGYRIELGEIEAVLDRHPAARESVVLVREDNPGYKRLVAYVVPAPGSAPSANELLSFLKQKLPEYMVPSVFVFLNEIPLTPNGKLDRKALPAPDQSIGEIEKPSIAPRDTLELELTNVWRKILGVKSVGVTDNFFDLGGHSLLAVRLFAEMEKTMGRRLPLATIFHAPTIEQLASIFRREELSESRFEIWSTYPSAVVPFQTSGSKPPLFWFNWGPWDFRLPRYLDSDQPVYGLQHQSQDGHRARYTTIETMAAHYIKEIRTVQTQGPYFLGGLCIGGMVAFEMAQQLLDQGQEVARLVLLDPSEPRSENISSAHKDVPNLSSQITWFRNKLNRHLHELAPLGPEEKLSYALVRVNGRIMGLTEKISWFGRRILCEFFGCPLPPFLRRQYIVSIYGRAARAYVPGLYQGRLILFKTQGRYHNGQSLWEKLIADDLETQELDTDHDNVFKEPYVRILAEKLTACLSEAQSSVREAGIQPSTHPCNRLTRSLTQRALNLQTR